MTTSDPIATAFAEPFAAFGLHLPAPAVEHRRDGRLRGRSWDVRWRWRPGGALDVRALSRFTNERWYVLSPDGTRTDRDVPSEMFVVGDDPARSEAESRAAWSAHGRAVAAAGMDLPPVVAPAPPPDDETMLWALDGDDAWSRSPLPPRPARS